MGNKKYLKTLAILLPFLIISTFLYVPKSNTDVLDVYLLDVGQGDSTYIRTPNNKDVLIDAGPKGKLIEPLENIMLRNDRHIDIFMITNPDADHFAGVLDIMDYYSIGLVIESGTVSTTKTYKEFKKKLTEYKIPSIIIKSRTKIILDKNNNIFLDILFPNSDVSKSSRNDGSIITTINYGEARYLLTGDTTQKTEKLIYSLYPSIDLNSDVLKVAHHGSRTSSNEYFLKIVSPDISFISAGYNNRYGHPHKEILERIKNYSKEVFISYQSGGLYCKSSGGDPVCVPQKQE
jgi:competence protein ComEC